MAVLAMRLAGTPWRSACSTLGCTRFDACATLSIPLAPDVGVIRCELMAILTVGSPGVDRGEALPSPLIFCIGYHLKVVGADAGPVAAEVIQHETVWYRTPGRLVGPAMGPNWRLSVLNRKLSIAARAKGPPPFPAFGRDGNLGPEPLANWRAVSFCKL